MTSVYSTDIGFTDAEGNYRIMKVSDSPAEKPDQLYVYTNEDKTESERYDCVY